MIIIIIINNSNYFHCKGPRLDRLGLSLLLTYSLCFYPAGVTLRSLREEASPRGSCSIPLPPNCSSHGLWGLLLPWGAQGSGEESKAAHLVLDTCHSLLLTRAGLSPSLTRVCPVLGDDLSARFLMAQAARLARHTPSISLETRSLGTGIDAAGSLNINASLGTGNQGKGGGREAVVEGKAFLPLLRQRPGRKGHPWPGMRHI